MIYMLKLAIDQGNSAIKFGIFDQQTLIHFDSIPNNDQGKLKSIIGAYKPQSAIICSVTDKLNMSVFDKIGGKVVILNHQTPLPFFNHYKTPETLGRDRIAAVAGAQSLFPATNILVIDAGTAITYDILLNDKYIGGSISPGMETRFKALNQFTGKLPLISRNEDSNIPGETTNQAIASGVINGMIFEIEGYRDFCMKNWGSLHTIITGGDSDFFVRKLKKPIFVNQNLVLLGLNRILENNA
ncbi:type III pantothenate kinase [Alkalitalea saponilacus]|nr:type III pantothenate kinase [Alkalitalea saponilacus]